MAQPPNPFEQQRPIPGVARILAVASGKGGVGKSTVASHLALALSKSGAKVGLLDADIYGPSVPRIFGALRQKPNISPQTQRIEPIFRYGLKLMSIGFLVDEGSAVVWRGPMLFKAMDQFLKDVDWGELDYLVIDLPPGTGDVQLSLIQKVPVTAVVAVTTPQNIAFGDVKKSLDMFHRIGIRVLGVVENMSCFMNPETSEKMPLFPKGELEAYLELNKIEKLAEVPFFSPLSESCEIGIPLVERQPSSEISKIFFDMAAKIRSRLETP